MNSFVRLKGVSFLPAILDPVKYWLIRADIVMKPIVTHEIFLTRSGHCNDVRGDSFLGLNSFSQRGTRGIGKNS